MLRSRAIRLAHVATLFPFRFPVLPAVLLVLFLSAPHADARVFLRWRTGTQSTRALTEAGGVLAHRSRVTINNGSGDLEVFGFDKPPEQVAQDIRRLFGVADLRLAEGTMAIAQARDGDRHLRFILLRLADSPQTLVFKIEQSAGDGRASDAPPAEHFLKSVPPYPGSTPTFFMEDAGTRTALAMSHAPTPAGAVRDFFRVQLASQGWKPAIPGTDKAGGPGLTIYLRGPEVCCCFVDNSREAGGSRITLLHKLQGVK